MRVGLNLATKPLVSHRRFLVGSALLGVVAGVLFLFLGWHFYTLRKADEDYRSLMGKIQQEMDHLQQQRQELEQFYARSENRNLQDRARFIGAVIEARSFNWTKMFMDLEHTLPAGVHVLKIEPKLENGSASVRFVVAGNSNEAKVKVLRAFEDSRSFSHIELTDEGLPKSGNGSAGDVFLLEFSAIYTGI